MDFYAYFYDVPEDALPQGAQYYFNVKVITIGISPKAGKKYLPKHTDSICYLNKITDARPEVVHIYVDEYVSDDLDIAILLHQVVEVHPDLGISFYDMLDFEGEDIWEI